ETQNFDQLRRLLALKRHEQPPPGYFNTFSSKVISRIEAGEHAEETVGVVRFILGGVWVQKLWGALDARAPLSGSIGAGVCGFLIAGVIYTDSPAGMKSPLAEMTPPVKDDGGLQVVVNTDAGSPLAPVTRGTDFPSQQGVAAVPASFSGDMPKPGLV